MENLTLFLSDNWEALSAIILWLAVRLIKTQRNYDLFEMILKFVGDNIIPNRRTTKTRLIFLLLVSYFIVGNGVDVSAQTNGNFKSVRFQNAGSNEAAIPLPSANNGAIYYNQGTNTFRAYQNGAWTDLIGGGGGGLVTASNGLNVVGGTDVQLGGTLTSSTIINTGALGLAFTSSQQTVSFTPTALTLGDIAVANISSDQGLNIQTGSFGNLGISSDNSVNITANSNSNISTSANIANSGNISFQTGTSASGNSGNINLTTGAAASGTRGNIILNANNTQTTTGDILSSQSTSNWTLSDLNAAFVIEPSGFDINLTSSFGDFNMNADAFNLTGTTLTTGLGTTGAIQITTGSQTAGGNSGLAQITTGDVTTGLPGDIILQPGQNNSGARGNIQLNATSTVMLLQNGQSLFFVSQQPNRARISCNENLEVYGDASFFSSAPSASLATGGTSLSSGNVSGGSGESGDVQISSGNSVGGATGNVTITTGIGGGQDGSIVLAGRQSDGVYIIMQNLPTSAAGLPSGAIWNNAGVLNIAP